jgi:flagellar hook assembly protein FlgD
MGNPYPNPFCPSTRINYTIPYRWSKDGKINLNPYTVTIDIYDILGRKLRCLVYRKMTPGNYTVMWNGKSENGRIVASGKYYCILKADELKQIRNLTLIK